MWLIYFRFVKVRRLAGSHKSFGFFPSRNGFFLCFGADLDGFLSQMMCTLELFVPQSALRCEARCSVLRWPLQCAAETGAAHCFIHSSVARKGCRQTSMRLFPGFVFAFCGLGRAAKVAGCRLLVVCETGVCVVRGQKTSSGKAAVTAFLPACCFILSGLHACAPGVPAGL